MFGICSYSILEYNYNKNSTLDHSFESFLTQSLHSSKLRLKSLPCEFFTKICLKQVRHTVRMYKLLNIQHCHKKANPLQLF